MTTDSYAAFLVDLDGTLLGRDERISTRVTGAIRTLASKLTVSIVSGREQADVVRFARELGLSGPQVSDSGAVVVDSVAGTTVWSNPLEESDAREIVGVLSSRGLSFMASQPDGSVTSLDQITRWNMTRVTALDVDEGLADELVAGYGASRGLCAEKGALPYNGLWGVNFTRAGVNKATGVGHLARMLGVDAGRMICAGDSYNDVTMLQACGLRIAMRNAPDELKAMADYVAPSVDEDGLAVAIEEFVLPRLQGQA